MSVIRPAVFQDGSVYEAEVIDQSLARSYKDETQLILTVAIRGLLKNDKNLADGIEPCPPTEQEVRAGRCW